MTDVLSWLMSAIAEVLDTHGLTKTQLFCSYPNASEMTALLSVGDDLRMIWGGDVKIAAVSKAAVRPDGLSLGFSDRKSFSVISACSYASMNEAARDAVAGRLYNDIFWFDQLGCGSPRAIFWLGLPGNDSADLYRRLDAIAFKKDYAVETGTALAKLSHMNERLASAQANKGTRFSHRLSVLETQLYPNSARYYAKGRHALRHHCFRCITISPLLNRHTQTVTHLGLSEQELSELVDVMARQVLPPCSYRRSAFLF